VNKDKQATALGVSDVTAPREAPATVVLLASQLADLRGDLLHFRRRPGEVSF
jgi:hypothetical protein